MKLFGRTSGYYLFWSGVAYFLLSVFNLFAYKFCQPELLSATWVCILMIPLVVRPVARYFNMDPIMFDLFKNKDKDNNVYNLPPPKLVPPMPEVEPPKEEPKIFYRIGVTDQNRVAFSMGHMEITMNKRGCQHMIDQLTVFMDQVEDDE